MTLFIFGDVNSSLGFGLSSFSLSCSSPTSSQPTKVGLERVKKSRCVYGRVKLFEPGGFRPKIDSLQAAKLVIIDQEGRVANNSLITHGDCLLTTEHENGNANWGLPPFLYSPKYRGSLVFCWSRLMFLSCMWVSSCL